MYDRSGPTNRTLAQTEEALVAFLRRDPEPKTPQDVANRLGIRAARASHILNAMVRAGKVKKLARGLYGLPETP